MGSVEKVGKLFERINGNEPANLDKWARQKGLAFKTLKASFCPRHGSHQFREYRSTGWASFVTFLAHQEK
jgi:hypothetical protein